MSAQDRKLTVSAVSDPAGLDSKRMLAKEMLVHNPFKTNRQVAIAVGISDKTVKNVRKEAHIPSVEQSILQLLNTFPTLSSRQLSLKSGISRGTIARYRRELISVDS